MEPFDKPPEEDSLVGESLPIPLVGAEKLCGQSLGFDPVFGELWRREQAPAWCHSVRAPGNNSPMPRLERELPRCSPISPMSLPDPLGEEAQSSNSAVVHTPAAEGWIEMNADPSFRLLMGGVVSVVLRYCATLGHVRVTPADLENLKTMSKEVWRLCTSPPLILVTLQSLASTPGLRVALLRWAKQENQRYKVPARPAEMTIAALTPWDGNQLWTFATWALAAQVTSKFLGQFQCVPEGVFLEGLYNYTRQLGTDQWALPSAHSGRYVVCG